MRRLLLIFCAHARHALLSQSYCIELGIEGRWRWWSWRLSRSGKSLHKPHIGPANIGASTPRRSAACPKRAHKPGTACKIVEEIVLEIINESCWAEIFATVCHALSTTAITTSNEGEDCIQRTSLSALLLHRAATPAILRSCDA